MAEKKKPQEDAAETAPTSAPAGDQVEMNDPHAGFPPAPPADEAAAGD